MEDKEVTGLMPCEQTDVINPLHDKKKNLYEHLGRSFLFNPIPSARLILFSCLCPRVMDLSLQKDVRPVWLPAIPMRAARVPGCTPSPRIRLEARQGEADDAKHDLIQ